MIWTVAFIWMLLQLAAVFGSLRSPKTRTNTGSGKGGGHAGRDGAARPDCGSGVDSSSGESVGAAAAAREFSPTADMIPSEPPLTSVSSPTKGIYRFSLGENRHGMTASPQFAKRAPHFARGRESRRAILPADRAMRPSLIDRRHPAPDLVPLIVPDARWSPYRSRVSSNCEPCIAHYLEAAGNK